ncbi:MAG: hypothetical protein LBU32_05605 [Clostridiales bacterium]|jgi:hypothetical protein|nr:hypothetical protein [Clostridiales bacterium]
MHFLQSCYAKGVFSNETALYLTDCPTELLNLDATIKGFTLTHESIGSIRDEVCVVYVEDDVTFSVNQVADIRESGFSPDSGEPNCVLPATLGVAGR